MVYLSPVPRGAEPTGHGWARNLQKEFSFFQLSSGCVQVQCTARVASRNCNLQLQESMQRGEGEHLILSQENNNREMLVYDADEPVTGSGLQRRQAKIRALSLSDRSSRQCCPASLTSAEQQPFPWMICCLRKNTRQYMYKTIPVSKSFTSFQICCPCQHGTFSP